uniref:Uncharacterized protein n=1 Tax=Tetranychus urticae TaxID=32264 RepID=T1KB84_TETUR
MCVFHPYSGLITKCLSDHVHHRPGLIYQPLIPSFNNHFLPFLQDQVRIS